MSVSGIFLFLSVQPFERREGIRGFRWIPAQVAPPGHSPGGVCLAIHENGSASAELFVGDTLFAGSIGRDDLPGGDLDTLLRSIRTVLFRFPDETAVYPGHGPATAGRRLR